MEHEPDADIGEQEAQDGEKEQEDGVVTAALMVQHRPLKPDVSMLQQETTIAKQRRVGSLLKGKSDTQNQSDEIHQAARKAALLHREISQEQSHSCSGGEDTETRCPGRSNCLNTRGRGIYDHKKQHQSQ